MFRCRQIRKGSPATAYIFRINVCVAFPFRTNRINLPEQTERDLHQVSVQSFSERFESSCLIFKYQSLWHTRNMSWSYDWRFRSFGSFHQKRQDHCRYFYSCRTIDCYRLGHAIQSRLGNITATASPPPFTPPPEPTAKTVPLSPVIDLWAWPNLSFSSPYFCRQTPQRSIGGWYSFLLLFPLVLLFDVADGVISPKTATE